MTVVHPITILLKAVVLKLHLDYSCTERCQLSGVASTKGTINRGVVDRNYYYVCYQLKIQNSSEHHDFGPEIIWQWRLQKCSSKITTRLSSKKPGPVGEGRLDSCLWKG